MMYLEWYVVWYHDKKSWSYRFVKYDDSENIIEIWTIFHDMIMRDSQEMSRINRILIYMICLIK